MGAEEPLLERTRCVSRTGVFFINRAVIQHSEIVLLDLLPVQTNGWLVRNILWIFILMIWFFAVLLRYSIPTPVINVTCLSCVKPANRIFLQTAS